MSREKAEEIFEQYCPNEIVSIHSHGAAQVAERVAERAGMDKDKAYVFGLLHDVGKAPGSGWRHIMNGYERMMEAGLPEVARICLTHSFQLKESLEFLPDEDYKEFVSDFVSKVEYDDYDRLIQLADYMSCADGVVPIEWRVCDVLLRHNPAPNLQDVLKKIYELKKYFAEKCGVSDLYEIFPEFSKTDFCKIPGEAGLKGAAELWPEEG